MSELASNIQKEIYKLLKNAKASYAFPLTSQQIGQALNVSASYIREQAQEMYKMGLVEVRRGPGGGYFVKGE